MRPLFERMLMICFGHVCFSTVLERGEMLAALLPELHVLHAIRLHQAVPGLLSLTSVQIAKQLRALGLALNLDLEAVTRQVGALCV